MTSNGDRNPLMRSINSETSYNHEGDHDCINQELTASRLSFRTNNHCLQILPGVMILILVLLERIAYYSLTGNLYLFLVANKFHWLYYNAIGALLLFTGISYLASLLGGWLSDAYFGRFKTIGFAFILFSAAYWFLFSLTLEKGFCLSEPYINITNTTNLTCEMCHDLPNMPDVSLFKENCCWTVIGILIFAAVGTGVVKANIAPFGAEQVRHTGADGLKIYLNWLYWCVNIGALIAILGITYVQQDKGFLEGYAIPAALLTGGTLIFWITYPLYAHQMPSGSSITRIYCVIKEAWKLNHRVAQEELSSNTVNKPDWLDMAKVRYGGKFHESVVEDVKSLSAIIKVFFILIPYWILYFQMQSTFLAQGLQMRLSFTSPNSTSVLGERQKFSIPAAWLMLFNVVFLIIFIPLLNHLIYPCLTRRGIQIGMLTRMGIGMMCAALSMVIAGILEIYRVKFIQKHYVVHQIIENTTFTAADMSILWQIPQYSLIGISEVFASVSGMEFACSQAPSRMQGAVMGFYYFCTGIGSFLGLALFTAYEKIFRVSIHEQSSGINEGKLYCFFFFLAAIQFLSLIIFMYISKNLKIRKLPSSNRNGNDTSSSTPRS